ncbi:2-C-methyl-D-erythritol 4-phosphate cytidylyltransferase [Clostridiaceae bacterium M8S5]|nr:2-C-methyl-D-erythritol 4-phosphate cytidylyltransferase [Clostridiaceae bacterium M8S5]
MSYENKSISTIIVAAGSGKRMKSNTSKQFMMVEKKPMLAYTIEKFQKCKYIDEIILVLKQEDIEVTKENIIKKYNLQKVKKIVIGGKERYNSVHEGLKNVNKNCDIVLIHDGARPNVSQEIILRGIMGVIKYKACVIGVPVIDTIKTVDENDKILQTPPRKQLWKAQTPQCFDYNLIMNAYNKALKEDIEFTDDSLLLEKLGYKVKMVIGDYNNIKVTVPRDLNILKVLNNEDDYEKKEECQMRVGMGYDVHKLVEGRKLILGGVEIEHTKGLLGHSDADVLVHALMDSILGALALGDIGKHFPDTEGEYKDISSMKLLSRVYDLMTGSAYEVVNIDCTISAQKPKLAGYIDAMRENIAKVLNINIDKINIKATTTEKLGFEGREEGISVQSICMLRKVL